MEIDEDFERFEPTRSSLTRGKCIYCERYFEVVDLVQYDPEKGEYIYTCPCCEKKFSDSEVQD
jgi:hypothetical protein